jgi:hypothetical protein
MHALRLRQRRQSGFERRGAEVNYVHLRHIHTPL